MLYKSDTVHLQIQCLLIVNSILMKENLKLLYRPKLYKEVKGRGICIVHCIFFRFLGKGGDSGAGLYQKDSEGCG